MNEKNVFPPSVFSDKLAQHQPYIHTVHGHMLRGEEVLGFLLSGDIYGLSHLADENIEEVHFSIPQDRQRGLYEEIAALRRSRIPHVGFHVKKDSSRHITEIVAFGAAESPSDVYVAIAKVRRGRRVTDIKYAYYGDDVPESTPVVSLTSYRERRSALVPAVQVYR